MRRRTLLGGMAAAALGGCAGLPTSGPVRTQSRRPQAQGPGEAAIAPNPPPQGASPDLVLQGFMLAMATYQPGYQAARQFLTEAARAGWDPGGGVHVYADGHDPRVVGGQGVVEAPLVGRLDPYGAYHASPGVLRHDFGLVREGGEWRISNPPPGLLLSRYLFTTGYTHTDVVFLDDSLTVLVPDTRYLPRGNRVADAAIRALLAGPSDWLRPAVVSAFPEGVRLVQPVVSQGTITIALDGLGEVSPQRATQIAAQLAGTLRQLPEVTGFVVTSAGVPLALPGAPTGEAVPMSVADRFDPVTRLTSQLFGFAEGRLGRVDAAAGTLRTVDGDLGVQQWDPASLAVSSDGAEAAVVQGDVLLRGPVDTAGVAPVPLPPGMTGLLRPQFTTGGALWCVSAAGRVVRVVGGTVTEVPAPALSPYRVVAFRIAPDGQRLAVVADVDGRRRVGLVRVERVAGDATPPAVQLTGWRTIPLTRDGTLVDGILDVGWTSSSTLAVLASSGQVERSVLELDVDAVLVREIAHAERWGTSRIVTSPRTGASARTVVLAQDGTLWQYVDAFRWARLADGLSVVAYPG